MQTSKHQQSLAGESDGYDGIEHLQDVEHDKTASSHRRTSKRRKSGQPDPDSVPPETGDFEEILQRIGNYGPYQKRLVYWFVYPQACFLPFFIMTIFLQMHVPDHWCKVPGRELTNFTLAEWKTITLPWKNKTGEFYKCSSYDVSNLLEEAAFRDSQEMPPLTFEEALEYRSKSTEKCSEWEFDTNHYILTAPADFKWVCDQRHLGTLALTVQNVGGVFSTLLLGPLADIIGRKPVYFLTIALQMIFGLAGLFAPEFYSFSVMTFIRALAFPAVWQAVFVLAMEVVGPKQRAMINGVLNVTWTIGVCALSFVAWLCKGHWVILGLIGNIPLGICFIYCLIVFESPRWLAQRNRIEEAADVMMKIAKQNGTVDKIGSREKLTEEMKRMNDAKEKNTKPVTVSFWHLFRHRKLGVRTLIITYGYTVILILYYGLHLNIATLGGDPYLNFALLGFFEFPAYVLSWWAMDRYGRRWVNAINLFIAGAGCLCVAVTPKEHWLVVVWSILGKFGSSGGFVLIYQQGCEIFPTVLRSTGLGFMSLVGAAVNAGVPQLVFWGEVYHYSIPYIVFGIMSMLGVVFAAFLPETLNKDLPETVEDSEHFGKDQKFWSWNLTKPAPEDKEKAETHQNAFTKPRQASDSAAVLVTSPTSSSASTTTAEAAAAATAALATITNNPCFTTSDSDDEEPIKGVNIMKNTYVVHQMCVRPNRATDDEKLNANPRVRGEAKICDSEDDVRVIQSHEHRCPSPNLIESHGRLNGLKPEGASVRRVSPHSYSTRV